MTDEQIIEWAREAGFRVFGQRIIAAQHNISGEASDAVRAFARLVRNATLEEAAAKADATVCDTHLPTGVRIYGRAAGDAIRSMKE